MRICVYVCVFQLLFQNSETILRDQKYARHRLIQRTSRCRSFTIDVETFWFLTGSTLLTKRQLLTSPTHAVQRTIINTSLFSREALKESGNLCEVLTRFILDKRVGENKKGVVWWDRPVSRPTTVCSRLCFPRLDRLKKPIWSHPIFTPYQAGVQISAPHAAYSPST